LIPTENIRWLSRAIFACLLVYLPALLVDVMNIDAAQYASISREMMHSKNWLEIYSGGRDYLDKPPLLFWLSAASFKIFGVSNWAYKLPSFLFAILGIYSTARLGELLYEKKTGLVAGVMLTFSFGMFVMTNDIRTDTILFGATIFATWQLLRYLKTKSRLSFIAAFSAIGIAMLVKGPLGFVLPAAALSSEFLYKRQWKNFIRPEWIIGIIIVALLIFPMCYGLYTQFDLHPEKVIEGHTGVSGLRFYFWTQSFGRITGESDWGSKYDNDAGPFFFTHTFLWVFFPWSILFVIGLFKNLVILVKSKFRAGFLPEMISTGGFVLMFLALSASRYKLPHYVYVLLPFASIIAARYLLQDVLNPAKKMLFRFFAGFHIFLFAALAGGCIFLLFIVFPGSSPLIVSAVFALLITGIVFGWKIYDRTAKLLLPLLFAMLAFYFTGNMRFYPELLKYESGTRIGRELAAKNTNPDDVLYLNYSDHALDFYYGQTPSFISLSELARMEQKIKTYGKVFVCTDEDGKAALDKNGYHILSSGSYDDYHVQFLTMNFLIPSTRASTLRKRYLLEINGERNPAP
jgi:4-amino-4-deoxy-L-arabinose transferase-like glycosyltransferase